MRTDEIRMASHFNGEAEAYAEKYRLRDPTGHSFRARRDLVKALLGEGRLGKILDVGGASGVYFEMLCWQADAYHIVDISPKMIELAQRIQSECTPLYCREASVYSLPYPSESFQTILGVGLIEYPDEPWRALAEMTRVAKPGGTLILSFPNAHSLMRKQSAFIYRMFGKPSPFRRQFTYAEVRKEAERLGLECVRVGGYNAQLIPFPFTWRLKPLAYAQALLLEPLLRRWGAFWGTGFIVLFRKKERC